MIVVVLPEQLAGRMARALEELADLADARVGETVAVGLARLLAERIREAELTR